MRQRQTIQNWIQECLTDREKEGQITMLSLIHMVGVQENPLHSVRFTGEHIHTADALAKTLKGKAQAYAQDQPGVQTFQLFAFYGGRTEPEAKFVFTEAPLNDNQSGLMTEGPDERGQIQQRMRHTEAGMGMIFQRQAKLDSYTIELVREMTRANSDLARENRESFTIVKDMMMKMVLDNHQREMEKLKYERDTKMFEGVMKVAPGLINQVMGKEVFPQSAEDTAIIDGIAEHLAASPHGDKTIEMITGMLPPQLSGAIAMRLQKTMEARRLEAERKEVVQKVAARHPDPAADAAGEVVSFTPGGYLNGRG